MKVYFHRSALDIILNFCLRLQTNSNDIILKILKKTNNFEDKHYLPEMSFDSFFS